MGTLLVLANVWWGEFMCFKAAVGAAAQILLSRQRRG